MYSRRCLDSSSWVAVLRSSDLTSTSTAYSGSSYFLTSVSSLIARTPSPSRLRSATAFSRGDRTCFHCARLLHSHHLACRCIARRRVQCPPCQKSILLAGSPRPSHPALAAGGCRRIRSCHPETLYR